MGNKSDKKKGKKVASKNGKAPTGSSCCGKFIKTSLLISVFVGATAALLALDSFDKQREIVLQYIPEKVRSTVSNYYSVIRKGITDQLKSIKKADGYQNVVASDGDKLFTKEQLAKHDGSDESYPVHLAILGRVYDVSQGEGKKHYIPGGGYNFFTGCDGTRAFMTGEFNKEGLRDDVLGLSGQQMLELDNWIKFYDTSYIYAGKVVGAFYDSEGKPTEALHAAEKHIIKAYENKAIFDKEKEIFPPCNSQFKPADNIKRVWCHPRSGGKDRGWTGVPRLYFRPGAENSRCACVRTTGPPFDDSNATTVNGDLDNPHMKLYDDCEPLAESCNLP